MTAWGKLIATTGSLANTVGANQPFRYRGYVYDEETGWYYLQSRYYDPTTCRFISADVLLSTGQGVLGHNSFAYCLNNSINRFDPSGCRSLLKWIIDFTRALLEGSGGGAGGHLFGSPYRNTEDDYQDYTRRNSKPKTNDEFNRKHGCVDHTNAINDTAKRLADSGLCSEIYVNRSLNTAGLFGSQRPDIIVKAINGKYYVWEFESPSQAKGSGHQALIDKISLMHANNPDVTFFDPIPWSEVGGYN